MYLYKIEVGKKCYKRFGQNDSIRKEAGKNNTDGCSQAHLDASPPN